MLPYPIFYSSEAEEYNCIQAAFFRKHRWGKTLTEEITIITLCLTTKIYKSGFTVSRAWCLHKASLPKPWLPEPVQADTAAT